MGGDRFGGLVGGCLVVVVLFFLAYVCGGPLTFLVTSLCFVCSLSFFGFQ